ncbi:MAG: hypothetical protein AAF360_18225 [Pseudomonadota bacterium]
MRNAALAAATAVAAPVAALIALVASTAPAGAAEVTIETHGVWTTEIVARGPNGGDRVACSASMETKDGVGVLLSFVSDGADDLGSFAALIASETAPPGAATRIGASGSKEVSGVLFEFASGETFFAKDAVGGDEDGAYAEVYPNPADYPGILKEMMVSPDLRVLRGDELLFSAPLTGFEAAFSAISSACRYTLDV